MSKITIGELARAADVGVQTIRYYERRGLLQEPPRTTSGYRQYSSDTVAHVKFIRRAQDLGFSLNEIIELISLKIEENTDCGDIRTVAISKINDIDEKISTLLKIKEALTKVVEVCPGEGPLTDCPILEVMETKDD